MVTLFKQFIIFFIFLILFSANLKPENLLKKNFNIVTCEGHEEACLIMEQFSFEYEKKNNKLEFVSHNFYDDPGIDKVTPQKQYYGNDGSFSQIIDIKGVSGNLFKLSLKGLIDDSFLINFYSFKIDGNELCSGTVE